MKKTFISFTLCVLFAQSYSQVSTKLRRESTSKEEQNFIAPTSATTETALNSVGQSFPYPVIFIHGLGSSADTWADFYNYALAQGWGYGGWLKFCLNSDENNYISNITGSQSDVTDFTANVEAADFYLVNFNVDADGTGYGSKSLTKTQSNQAAITKQGLALKNAIKNVLKATGRDKVILFGHSMGGLAAREYLQNKVNWQSDGQHHIAKLITSGTPHGGSNSTAANLSSLAGGIDEKSDAVRDLRRSYFYSGKSGVYLYGGTENNSTMNDFLISTFYNVDVNCNGVSGNLITGLNQKSIFADLDYACIVGKWILDITSTGDGVVDVKDAQLKNFYPALTSETFNISSNSISRLHTRLTEYTSVNFQGLDEPDYFNLSYTVKPNTYYNGFITYQAPDAETQTDYDDYVFNVGQSQNVTITVDNINISDLGVSLFKSTNLQSAILSNRSTNRSKFTTNALYLTAGTYYLEVDGNATTDSWKYPYNFKINVPLTSPTVDVESLKISVYPNPASEIVNVKLSDAAPSVSTLILTDLLGKTVFKQAITSIETELDISAIPLGIYFVSIYRENEVVAKSRIVINR